MVTAATIYMALLGAGGLKRVAQSSQQQTAKLVDMLTGIDGVDKAFDTPHFHEAVLTLDRPVGPVLDALAEKDVLGGLDLSARYPELGNGLLVCATETKTDEDLAAYRDALAGVMAG